MHTDGAKEFTQGRWQEILSQDGGIKQTFAEPFSPWQNLMDAGIQEHKKQVLRVLRRPRASNVYGIMQQYMYLKSDLVLHTNCTSYMGGLQMKLLQGTPLISWNGLNMIFIS